MPLGFERLNERTTRPNPLINFIKPLPGSSSATAKDFLEAIAAQCYPVMKANYIAVMALEEYEWNPEFIGRNFNAGEVIQLVLRSRSGAWLPFKYVQMTMMHELAHCKQMNHSREFWKVRNKYAEEMRGLWAKKYLGEGLWGRGRNLESGRFMHDVLPDARDLPKHTCGGTYRRRGRKRKRGGAGGVENGKTQLSYAERKQRRILKKFGDPAKAVTLGTDEDVRLKLEDGKKTKGKPRVAGSNRGRELRAAAALARFEQQSKTEEIKHEEDDSDTEDEYDWPLTDNEDAPIQKDGKDFVRICEAEDEQDEDVKREMEELNDLYAIPKAPSRPAMGNAKSKPAITRTTQARKADAEQKPVGGGSNIEDEPEVKPSRPWSKQPRQSSSGLDTESDPELEALLRPPANAGRPAKDLAPQPVVSNTCPICSMDNANSSLICIACSNVLKPDKMPNHWRCKSETCCESAYINVGDHGRCQLCGAVRPG